MTKSTDDKVTVDHNDNDAPSDETNDPRPSCDVTVPVGEHASDTATSGVL